MKAVQTALQQLLQQAAPNQWRGLVVLQDATGKPQAQLLVNGSQSKTARPDVLCMGGQFLVPLNAYRAYLGRAYSAVVLDFRQQQHADALAAMAGTVVGGG